MFKFTFFTIVTFAFLSVKGQSFLMNTCDSAILGKDAYKWCIDDSVYTSMIYGLINHFSYTKTAILPKFRKARQDLKIPDSISIKINNLRRAYDSTLKEKLWVFGNDMNVNSKYVSPKGNIVSLITLQYFKIYPDVYAILLNDIHLILKPASNKEDINRFKVMIREILEALPSQLNEQLITLTTAMEKAKNMNNTFPQFSGAFQGEAKESEREQFRIINFLLWKE